MVESGGGRFTLGIGETDSWMDYPKNPITGGVFKGHEKPIPIFAMLFDHFLNSA